MNRFTSKLAIAVAALALIAALPGAAQVADVSYHADGLDFAVAGSFGDVTLRVAGNGQSFERTYGAGETISFDALGLADGQYRFELVASPALSLEQRRALEAARGGDDGALMDLRARGEIPQGTQQSGYFRVAGGAVIVGGAEEAADRPAGGPQLATRDQVILDDLIVDGSACIGQDCVNGESFGFDTLRLKENNLRIKFQDTSSTASFPTNDWELTANESSNGGAEKFSITDVTGGRIPFTIEASAPSNSLYVDDGGRLGLGTNVPVVDLHVVSGNTPTLRLQQDGTSGFTPQTWDVAGNEANFFIRDATNGSTLPFRIEPGAASNVIYIENDEDVGFGTTSPTASVHLRRTDGTAQLLVEEASGTATFRKLMRLVNNGRVDFEMENTNAGSLTIWQFIAGIADGGGNTNGQGFAISRSGSGVTEFEIQGDGDVFVGGALAHASSRALKENFSPVNSFDILDRVKQLPLTTWTYKRDTQAATHLGPVAEDFFAAFGLGETDKHIAPSDSAGIALASIQALAELVEAKDQRISALEARLAALEKAIAATP